MRVCVCYSYKVMFFFLIKFLQDITVSPFHQSDSGQRHCVGRLCYSQGGKWLSSLEHAANMHEQITFSMAERATVKENTCKLCTHEKLHSSRFADVLAASGFKSDPSCRRC